MATTQRYSAPFLTAFHRFTSVFEESNLATTDLTQMSDAHNGYAYEDEARHAYDAEDYGLRADDADIGVKGEYVMEEADDEFDTVVFDDEDALSEDTKGSEPITEEDAWKVISAHFHERGLVSQQLDSFDVFMTNTMQVSSPPPQPLLLEGLGP